ncbi:MAG: response regulator [Muribaculaceae bacterium]|nr:response regulator [Muribaculaceae bacterium]
MILIVDDDNAVRMSLSLALKRAGYEPVAVGNEDDALAAVRDERLRLAVLDMNLTLSTTGQQGIATLRKFRILRPDMPVIMITGWGTIPLAVEAMNLGAADFITKPWSNAELLAKIKKIIAKNDMAKEAAARTETLEEMERDAISEALRRCDGNMSEAAKQLGITRQTLYRRIEKFKL